jgi:hypothetical protein
VTDVRRTTDNFNLTDRELIGCVMALDYAAGEDALDREQGEVMVRMVREAKRRGLQSPEHRSFVSAWLAQKIATADG